MKVSITIPQIFYDIIARVLPGFFFCVIYKVIFKNTYLDQIQLIPYNNSNFISSLSSGIGYIFIYYFIGILFTPFVFLSEKDKVKSSIEKKNKSKFNMNMRYHKIRLKNESAGFRIVKLRAEAKLLEVTRTSIFLLFLISLVIIFYNIYNDFRYLHDNWLIWVIKLFLLIFIFIGLKLQEKYAWQRYYGNIAHIYRILFK